MRPARTYKYILTEEETYVWHYSVLEGNESRRWEIRENAERAAQACGYKKWVIFDSRENLVSQGDVVV